MRRILLAALALAMLWIGRPAAAAEFGTAEEARALLVRAIVEVRLNPTAAVAKFGRNDGGFVDRDLYVFCFNGGDGKIVANVGAKNLVGSDIRAVSDVTGNPFGQALYRDPREGVIKTFKYLWPRPGDTKPVAKESYVARLGGLICGVGYYK